MKLTTKYLLALITTLLLLNLSVAEARRTSGMGALANIGPAGPQGLQGPAGVAGVAGVAGSNGANGTNGAAASCTPYIIGDTAPDGIGKVFYVDGSGCHGLEAQTVDGGPTQLAILSFSQAKIAAADFNSPPCTTSASLTPKCWHLPSKTELNYLFEQKDIISGFTGTLYWSGTLGDSVNYIPQAFALNMSSGASQLDRVTITHLYRSVRAF